MWALSCFRGFAFAKKTAKSNNFNGIGNGNISSSVGLTASEAAALPLLEASSLSTEWASSQFPVACIALEDPANGNTITRQVTVLWHNAANLEVWARLTSTARNPALMEAMVRVVTYQQPTQQVVLVAGSIFTAQGVQPAAEAARFTSELLAAVSVPVHVSLVQFSTGPQGIVVPRALLLVCRAPLLPPRHVDAGPAVRQLRSRDTAYQGPSRQDFGATGAATGTSYDIGVGMVSARSVSGVVQEGELEERTSVHSDAVTAHRQRDAMVAAHLPAIITVFTLDGQVLHQNPASVQYMGPMPVARIHGAAFVPRLHAPSCAANEDGAMGHEGLNFGVMEAGVCEEGDWGSGLGVLGYIFKYEQAKLRQMFDVLLGRGNVWQGIVRVPTSEGLKHKLVYGRFPHQPATQEEGEGAGLTEKVEVEAGATTSPTAGEVDNLQPPMRQHAPSLFQSRSSHHHHQQQQQHKRHMHLNCDQQQQQEREDSPPPRRPTQQIEEEQRIPRHLQLGLGNNQQQPGRQEEEQQQRGRQPSRRSEQRIDETPNQREQQRHLSHQKLPVGSHFPSSLFHDGTTNTQNSSDGLTNSGSRNNHHLHHYHRNNSNNHRGYAQQVQQQQPPPESGATTGEVLESAASDAAAPVGTGALQDLPHARSAARASVVNLYDADADPLATSTWTVLADPTSRGWPSTHHHHNHHHPTYAHSLTSAFVGNPMCSRARRPSKRARPSTMTAVDRPNAAREEDGGAPTPELLGLTRRWGSATQTVPPLLGRRLLAGTPGLVPGSRMVTMLGGVMHHSQPNVAPGLGMDVGTGLSRRQKAFAPVGYPLDTAVATVAVAAAGAAGTGSGNTSALAVLAAERTFETKSLPLVRRHDGDGGGSGSTNHGSLRRGDGSTTVPGAATAPTNTITNTITSGTGSNTTGISRVLVFANSLRSAPYAPPAVAASASSLQLGTRPLYDSSATTGNAQATRAQSATAIRRQSKSYDRVLVTVAHAPPSPIPGIPPASSGNSVTAIAAAVPPSQQADSPSSPPPVPAEPARPEISALAALLRARRSTLAASATATISPSQATTTAPVTPNATDPAAVAGKPTPAVAGVDTMAALLTTESTMAPARLASSGVVIVNPATRHSIVGGSSGHASGGILVTAGEAELAMALLPYSQSKALDRQLGNGSAAGSGHQDATDDVADGAMTASMDGTGGGGANVSALGASGGEHDVWHEISAVSALDPVTGSAVLVVTQVDVTAKVRAERHLVHVMCAERRLLLQLFPRHVLQHVVEANPLLHTATGANSLESLPREWLDEGDWRPVLRDCDKLATMHPQATVLFADIAGFDDICMELPPQKVLAFLNDLFAKFDNSIEPFGVHKMETIGGLFIVAGGLLREEEDGAVAVRDRGDPLHAEKVFMFAKAMLNVAAQTKLPTLEEPVKLRIGIHTGPVMSGIVGTRVPRFVLFGDTVNTASRMQTSATPGSVHVSEDTRALLPHENWTPTGGVQIKGKGLLNTYVWVPEDQIHYLVPPAVSTPESTHTGGGGRGGARAAPAAAFGVGNGSRAGTPPPMIMSTLDTSSCTSSDVFLAQQLSFTSAIPPTLLHGKSRLRNEGGYLED